MNDEEIETIVEAISKLSNQRLEKLHEALEFLEQRALAEGEGQLQ